MIRHPVDGSQWRNLNREYPQFDNDPRNIRFALSTDGMNPYGEFGSAHSTWPVTLCMFNLPPWLCLKRKFIMMPVLIEGPKEPGAVDPSILLSKEDTPYLRCDHAQGTFVKRKIINVPVDNNNE